jgi:CRISPR/Cas system CSM-associated protein Csm3 (group 7 of RAMP superfamily)
MLHTQHIKITYCLTCLAPSHFGTGLRAGLIHRTVSRDAEGYLYLPGSTLKGALRERCEQLARLFDLSEQEPHSDTSALAEFTPRANIVTRIFGSRFQPASLYFDDASLHADDKALFDGEWEPRKYQKKQFFQRTQVGMSRLTGTASRGLLYTSEFGLSQLRFTGEIYGLLEGALADADQANGPTYALVLLVAGLLALDRLGGSKSRGAGQCECAITEVTLNGQPTTVETILAHMEHLEYYDIVWE